MANTKSTTGVAAKSAPPTVPLVRPLFFGGQTLTDRDLTDLVGWVDRRFGLRRLTEGWGVVCGFDVIADLSQVGGISADPGYAVDPAGGDLYAEAPVTATLVFDDQWAKYAKSLDNKKVTMGPFKDVPLCQLAVFDVAVAALAADQSPAPVGGPCGTTCKPTRSRDAVQLVSQRVNWDPTDATVNPAEPDKSAIDDLLGEVRRVAPKLYALPTAISTLKTDAQVKYLRELLTVGFSQEAGLWLRTFPDLPRWLTQQAKAGSDPLATPWGVAGVLAWMINSYQQRHRPCPPPPCPAPVPLARVYVRVESLSSPHVLFIDNHPPYRRPFARHNDPAIDLRRYIGDPLDIVRKDLSRHRISLDTEALEVPASADVLLSQLQAESQAVLAFPGDAAVAVLSGDKSPDPFANRVVGIFRGASARPSIGSPTTNLQIAFYKPDDKPSEFAVVANPPNSADLLPTTVKSLPYDKDARVKLAVTPVNLGSANNLVLDVFDDLRLRYTAAIAGWAPGTTVAATIALVQDSADDSTTILISRNPTLTAIVRENTAMGRSIAVPRPFGKSVGQYPIRPALKLADANGKDLPKSVPAIAGSMFPIQVQMSNPTPSDLTGSVSYANQDPDPKKLDTDNPHGKVTINDVTAPAIPDIQPNSPAIFAPVKFKPGSPSPVDDPDKGILLLNTSQARWVFWSPGMSDFFGRTAPVMFGADTTVTFNPITIVVAVKKQQDNSFQLNITNSADKDVTLTALKLWQASASSPLTTDFATITLKTSGPPATATIKITGGVDGQPWRARIDFTYDGSSLTAVIDPVTVS